MAIQFPCVSCGKAIEIDQQWALRTVECPFCHDTVRAPGISTLVNEPPMATPADESPHAFAPPAATVAPVMHAAPAGSSGSKLAITALVLAVASFVLFVWMSLGAAQAISERITEDTTPAEMQQLVMDAANAQEPWVTRIVLTGMASFGTWIAALVCAIVAVSRTQGKRLAYVALAITLFPALLFMLSVVFQL